MTDFRERKQSGSKKSIPGCMGKMVNLFDWSTSMPRNRLLMERGYGDGSLLKDRLDTMHKKMDLIGDHVGGKLMTSLKWNLQSKSNGTPMKTLIAQEISEEESKLKPPSVIARLMGLDGLPAKYPVSTVTKHSTKQGSVPRNQQIRNGSKDQHLNSHFYSPGQIGSDTATGKFSFVDEGNPHKKVSHYGSTTDEKIALIRQKFIEAKRLATDDKLRQSKEFQDAVDILSSNRDLFLKVLQDPESLFSSNVNELQPIVSPFQTNCIRFTKPSKTHQIDCSVGIEMKGEKQRKNHGQSFHGQEWENSNPCWHSALLQKKDHYSLQPTRIVVLKPSPGSKPHTKNLDSYKSLSVGNSFGDSGTDYSKTSRKIAKEITQKMQEPLISYCSHDETSLPYILSNGCEMDEIMTTENDYIEEGNFSDSEIMTPTSRHSWDYKHYDSPFSTSSLSRASYTSESSVSREAKKRLSERWTMMKSTGTSQEQRQVRRSSSTLGEMLTLSEVKQPLKSSEESKNAGLSPCGSRSCGGEDELKGIRSQSSNHVVEGEGEDHSPRYLSRSRSVPTSSATVMKVGLSNEAPDPNARELIVSKYSPKTKNGMSSLKQKVSSFFFGNKKTGKEKLSLSAPISSQAEPLPCPDDSVRIPPKVAQQSSEHRNDDDDKVCTSHCDKGSSFDITYSSFETSSYDAMASSSLGECSSKASSSMKPQIHNTSGEDQNQPSPISVLGVRFEDDALMEVSNGDYREPAPNACHKSKPADSQLIESCSRALFSDADGSLETSKSPETLIVPYENAMEGPAEWFLHVCALVSAASSDHESSNAFLARWHSLESPLDPALLEECINTKQEAKQLSEAKRRQQRSEHRLLFDSVNAALLQIAKGEIYATPRAAYTLKMEKPCVALVAEEIWGRIMESFSSQSKWHSGELDVGQLIEREVREEVAGTGWVEMAGLEIDGLGREIQGEMLDGLVEEALADLTLGFL